MSKSIFNTAIFNNKNITNSNTLNEVTTDLIIAENLEVTGTLTNAEVQANTLKTGITVSQSNAISANVGKLTAITYDATNDVTEFSESVKIDSGKSLFIGSKNIGSSLAAVENDLGDKQDTLTAGDNISITSAGVISSTDTNTTYSAKSNGSLVLNGTEFSLDLTNIGSSSTYTFPRDVVVATDKTLTAGALKYYSSGVVKDVLTEIATKQNTLTAGNNINITSAGVISSTDTNTTYSAKSNGSLVLNGTEFSLDLTNIGSSSTYTFPRDVVVATDKKLTAGALEYYKSSVIKDVSTEIDKKADLFAVDSASASQMAFATESVGGSTIKTLKLNMAAGGGVADGNSGLLTANQIYDYLVFNYNFKLVNGSTDQLSLANNGVSPVLNNLLSVRLATSAASNQSGLVTGVLLKTELDKKADLFAVDSDSANQMTFDTESVGGNTIKTLKLTLATSAAPVANGLVTGVLLNSELNSVTIAGTQIDSGTISDARLPTTISERIIAGNSNPQLKIKATATSSTTTSVEIIGARNSSTSTMSPQLVFRNFDRDVPSGGSQIGDRSFGLIGGMTQNTTANTGGLVFQHFSDGINATTNARISSSGNWNLGSGGYQDSHKLKVTGATSFVGNHLQTGTMILSSSLTANSIAVTNNVVVASGLLKAEGVGNKSTNGNSDTAFFVKKGVALFDANSGNGMTNANGVLQINCSDDGKLKDGIAIRPYANNNNIINFMNGADSVRGKIKGNNSNGVQYQTSSDRRLKSDIEDAPSYWELVKNLNTRSFKWTGSGVEDIGFIAQEVHAQEEMKTLKPVFEIGDYYQCDISCCEFDETGYCENPIVDMSTNEIYPHALDYGQFTPYLWNALQEAIVRIEKLEEQIKDMN